MIEFTLKNGTKLEVDLEENSIDANSEGISLTVRRNDDSGIAWLIATLTDDGTLMPHAFVGDDTNLQRDDEGIIVFQSEGE